MYVEGVPVNFAADVLKSLLAAGVIIEVALLFVLLEPAMAFIEHGGVEDATRLLVAEALHVFLGFHYELTVVRSFSWRQVSRVMYLLALRFLRADFSFLQFVGSG